MAMWSAMLRWGFGREITEWKGFLTREVRNGMKADQFLQEAARSRRVWLWAQSEETGPVAVCDRSSGVIIDNGSWTNIGGSSSLPMLSETSRLDHISNRQSAAPW